MEQRLLRIFYKSLDCLTVQHVGALIRSSTSFQDRSLRILRGLYRLSPLWMLIVQGRILRVICLVLADEYEMLFEEECLSYLLLSRDQSQDLLFVISLACYLSHVINVGIYNITKLESLFPDLLRQLDHWNHLLVGTKYTLMNCLFARPEVSPRRRMFVVRFKPELNPYLRRCDTAKIDRKMKMLETVYLLTQLILLPVLFGCWLGLTLLYRSKLDIPWFSLRMIYCLSDVFFTLPVNIFLGIVNPLFLLHIIFFGLQLFAIPAKRKFAHQPKKRNRKSLRLLRRMRHNQDMFVFILQNYKKINQNCVCKVFTKSVFLVMCASAILTLQMIISELIIEIRILIPVIVSFTFFIITFMIYTLTKSTDCLYSLARPYIRDCADLGRVSHFRLALRHRLKLSLFLEVVHSRRPFCFRLANFGKINQLTLLKAVPMYTCFIMFILPFLDKRMS